MVPEFKRLGELVAADPKLKNRVVISKVRSQAPRPPE
jgi:protein disulfide-isomerase A6